ncbi:hypothetical protein HER14_08340, partial [Acidithiobacillus thiooxidans]
MYKHTMTLKRDGMKGFLSRQRIGTDVINALNAISGVKEPEIVSESNEQVKLTYSWVDDGNFMKIDDQLAGFGL